MATRTALGTASSKTSGATLTLASVNPPIGSTLIVAVAFENSQGAPSTVEWNGRILNRRIFEDNAISGHGLAVYLKRRVHNDVTADVNVTWGASITARAMVVLAVEGAPLVDEKTSNSNGATQSPSTGPITPTLDEADEFVVTFFSSRGPSDDTPGTPQIRDDGVFTNSSVGQRVGTTGGGALTNVTIAEAFLELTSTTGTRGRINGDATQRRWANGLVAMTQDTYFRQGITPTDVQKGEELFAAEVPSIDPAGMMFHYNEDKDQWEVHEVTASTLIATRSKTDPDSWT